MNIKKNFISVKKRYKPIILSEKFSDEEMANDWTLSDKDKIEINKYRKKFRLFVAIQLCSIKIYARFLTEINDLSPLIINYINNQLNLAPSLFVVVPNRDATLSEYRKKILDHLKFSRFDEKAESKLEKLLEVQAKQGVLPDELFQKAEEYLLLNRIVLPGPTVTERLVVSVCSKVHDQIFESFYKQLSPEIKKEIDKFLSVSKGQQRSYFYQFKEYPPSATITSIQEYLKRYFLLIESDIDDFEIQFIDPAFLDYLFKVAKKYNSKDIKQLKEHKRYALMICFLLETQKILLDHLVNMHDQYITDMCRKTKNVYEKKHREFRKRQKKAIDNVIKTTQTLLDWPDEVLMHKKDILIKIDEEKLQKSLQDLKSFKYLMEKGYANLLLKRYPSLRKYFAKFILLPFSVKQGSEGLLKAIEIIRQLDSGKLKNIPNDAPLGFIPKELGAVLKNEEGKVNRNAWELGLALSIKDKFRSGDLYFPKSKQHTSFWDFALSESQWQETREETYAELKQPKPDEAKTELILQFKNSCGQAEEKFNSDNFAEIHDGKLLLKRVDKAIIPTSVTRLQKTINSCMPSIRIEELLMEVDKLTNFSDHFIPTQEHKSRPKNFYKTLIATIISQATNLGIVAMSASVKGISIDMLRHVLQHYIREETLKEANAKIVNQHHQLPLSRIHGDGTLSSSDGQRFKIRADSLLASYYPRYYGYYNKAIGIYTHVSDQYSVFNTKVISCAPREALYVLDGLLENNTILKIREHTTDTHGYTEIIFALCYLLGYYFMPRIRDLKDQQLYRIDKNYNYGVFTPLLNKTVDLSIIEEQWDSMIHVAHSLKKRTAPAHIVVQRLTNSFPADRLSKAFTNLGRIIKTEYILRYITDPELRRTVQVQLNKGEYRHKLPRWIFFANQGEFTTGDYEEIMNKASCLSLVSNAILYWNTIKINEIVENFQEQKENIDNEALSHISFLPFKHVLPNGSYFI